MNWLAKINLNIVVERLGPFKSALLLIFVIATSIFCGYRLGNFFHSYQTQTIAQQKLRLNDLYQQLAEHVSRINTLEVELAVERLANDKSRKSLKNIEQKHFEVKKQLAFYEKVMAPEKQADGVVLDDFIISPTESVGHFRFQVVLVQQQKQKRYAKGVVDFVIEGSQNNQPATIKLSQISKQTSDDLSFNFQYFQIVEGEFSLPDNFKPEQVLLSVTLPKGRWQKYSQLNETYKWPLVLENNVVE